jgi:hypothetical protein
LYCKCIIRDVLFVELGYGGTYIVVLRLRVGERVEETHDDDDDDDDK